MDINQNACHFYYYSVLFAIKKHVRRIFTYLSGSGHAVFSKDENSVFFLKQYNFHNSSIYDTLYHFFFIDSIVMYFTLWYWSTFCLLVDVMTIYLFNPGNTYVNCLQSYFTSCDGLVQERRSSSALALELHVSCTDPLIYNIPSSLCYTLSACLWFMQLMFFFYFVTASIKFILLSKIIPHSISYHFLPCAL